MQYSSRSRCLLLFISLSLVCGTAPTDADEIPPQLARWLGPQNWQRDTDGPVVSLGESGQFDDTHIFGPAVIREGDRYLMWYCGARGKVKQRVFRLGLATSAGGREFTKHKSSPVLALKDGKHSVLTPTLLRSADGSVLRENGKLRMWFSSTWFAGDSGLHTLHETTSEDGIDWEDPSGPLLKNVYAPTIIKTGETYHLWYTDVSHETWAFRHATSDDGRRWQVTEKPVLQLGQTWESGRLFYPTVLKVDDVYLMWYGSYWPARANTTALGMAVSLDGKTWHKHPQNPVLRPDPDRPWESHYVTSQSVIRMADGSFRIWYASRKKPPFLNKYFAINTAVWDPSKEKSENEDRDAAKRQPAKPRDAVDPSSNSAEFPAWRDQQRAKLRTMLGIPEKRVALEAEKRGQADWEFKVPRFVAKAMFCHTCPNAGSLPKNGI